MGKQVLKVDANDFAQVVSCVGFVTTIVGLSLPDGPQKELAIKMGDDLIDMLFKYSSEDKQSEMQDIRNLLFTNEADTSVVN